MNILGWTADMYILTSKLFFMFYIWLKDVILTLVPRRFRYKNLEGEIVLITGGGSGIGRLLALKLSSLGCRVVVWDINEEENLETAFRVKSQGGECYSYVCDVTRREEVYEVARTVKEEVGSVSILVNNAGIVTGKSLLNLPDDLIEKTFHVNAISHFWSLKAFLPDMMSAKHGHIVTIASVSGFFGVNCLTDYGASKAAAVIAHESLYFELKNDNHSGIEMTLVAPFFIDTGMFEGANGGYFSFLKAKDVADRIVSAVRCSQETVFIPSYFYIIIILRALMPLAAFSVLFDLIRGFQSMKTFIGKQKKKLY